MKEKDNSGKIILSLLIGITAGAVAGLLLAPETGEDTRASLKDSANKLGDDLNKWLQKSQETLDSAKANAASLVEEGRTAANEAFTSLSNQAGSLAEQAKQLGTEAVNKVQQVAADVSGQVQQVVAQVTDQAQQATAAASDKVEQASASVAEETQQIEDKAKAKVHQAASPQPTPKVDPIVAKAQANAAKDDTAPAGS